MSDITILISNYLDHQLVYLNYEILSQNEDLKLIIVNSMQEKSHKYDNIPNKSIANIDDKRVTILKGVDDNDVLTYYMSSKNKHNEKDDPVLTDLSDLDRLKHCAGSYYHAMNLNLALPLCKTRYIMSLDADFFIMPKLTSIVKYIQTNNLICYGTSYTNNDWGWLRGSDLHMTNLPCARCMIIDTKYFPLSDINFLPEYEDGDDERKYYADTGYLITKKLMDSHLKTEMVNACTDQQCEFCDMVLPTHPFFAREVYYWKKINEIFGFHVKATRDVNFDKQNAVVDFIQKHVRFNAKYNNFKGHYPNINSYGPYIYY